MPLGERVSEPDQRVQLINAWWREREQLSRDRAVVRRIEPGTEQRVERGVDARFVLAPPPRERRARVDLSCNEPNPCSPHGRHRDRLIECVGDRRRRIGGDERRSMARARRRERDRARHRRLPDAALSTDDEQPGERRRAAMSARGSDAIDREPRIGATRGYPRGSRRAPRACLTPLLHRSTPARRARSSSPGSERRDVASGMRARPLRRRAALGATAGPATAFSTTARTVMRMSASAAA